MQTHLSHTEVLCAILIASYGGAIGAILALAYVAARSV